MIYPAANSGISSKALNAPRARNTTLVRLSGGLVRLWRIQKCLKAPIYAYSVSIAGSENWNSDIRIEKKANFSKKLHVPDFSPLSRIATRGGLRAHRRHERPQLGTDTGGDI